MKRTRSELEEADGHYATIDMWQEQITADFLNTARDRDWKLISVFQLGPDLVRVVFERRFCVVR